jgi:hypothetical protein
MANVPYPVPIVPNPTQRKVVLSVAQTGCQLTSIRTVLNVTQ